MGIVYGLERHRNRSPRIRNAVCFIIVAQRVIHVKCIVCRSPVTVKIASATSTLRNKIINCYVIEFSSVLRFSFTLPCRVCCAVCTVHCVSGNREVCPLICFETIRYELHPEKLCSICRWRKFELKISFCEKTRMATLATTLRWQNQHQTNMVVCTARNCYCSWWWYVIA